MEILRRFRHKTAIAKLFTCINLQELHYIDFSRGKKLSLLLGTSALYCKCLRKIFNLIAIAFICISSGSEKSFVKTLNIPHVRQQFLSSKHWHGFVYEQ